jgi:hypothetical protein
MVLIERLYTKSTKKQVYNKDFNQEAYLKPAILVGFITMENHFSKSQFDKH